MFVIIHGSHRHGYHWEISTMLKNCLIANNVAVEIIDLAKSDIKYCCGHQYCQDKDCIYKDEFTTKHKDLLLNADGIYIVCPTYFNMPSGKLKTFMDRTNALLPIIGVTKKTPLFGAWVSGEANADSIKCNMNLLIDYAEIMGWKTIKDLNIITRIENTRTLDESKIRNIADNICKNLLDWRYGNEQ